LYVTDINSAILVFDNASTMNGNVAPGRTISGSNTTLKGPFGAWLDSSSNRLYVANVEDNSILVFNNANTVNGNVAPDRTISGSNTTLSAPEGIWLDLTTNQLYVANGNNKSILVFNNASTVNGNVTPDRTVIGPNTTLNTPVDLWLETITIS
jgi:DNA-binding beta-propeller fold protein YncE